MKLSPLLTIKLKAIISSLLLISFIIVTITGILLWTNNEGILQFLGLDSLININKHKVGEIHTTRGFIMSGIIVIHLFFNFKMFITEIKTLFKK